VHSAPGASRREAEHAGVDMPSRRQKTTSANKSSQKIYYKEVRNQGTYILERTRTFFTGRTDEPYLGAGRFKPANSGDVPLRPATPTAATRSPACSGADTPASAMTGVELWPPPTTRDT
jgi:hypothetical protein